MSDKQTTDPRCPAHGSYVQELDGSRHCGFVGCGWSFTPRISQTTRENTNSRGPHRYKVIYTVDRTLLVRDDGKRIDRMIIWPDDRPDCGKWEPWATYGDNGMDASVADELFRRDRL